MLTQIVLYALPFLLVFYLYQTYQRLSHIPGPFLAKFTNLSRAYSVYRRQPHDEQVALHKQHGDFVRLGPNVVSVSGPDYVNQIYGIGKGLVKSDFYSVFQNIVNGKRAASLVAVTDESEHAKTKRTIAHAYSLSTLVEFEPLVDNTTTVFLSHLEKTFAATKSKCDLGRWLQFYAFDVIGELTFSKRLGFIEQGEDVSDVISSIGKNFDYFSVLGQIPWLDETFLGKNPLYIKYFSKPVASPILKFAQNLLQERLAELDGDNSSKSGKTAGRPFEDIPTGQASKPDFLTRFLATRKDAESGAETMTDRQLLSNLFMNINAGSDTIASTLRGIFYHLLKNPDTLEKLMTELRAANESGNLTLPCPTWHETQSSHMPYLRAVIKEGIRMNPALSLPLERVVPKDGLTLTTSSSSTSTFLPPGTIVGINPYVLHRNPILFPSPESWNPSRWLPSSSPSSEATLKQMDAHILSFGAGKRSCMGKNIAMLELHKIVPAILMKFDVALVDPEAEWEVMNSWVLNQKGLDVYIGDREEVEV